MKRGVTTSSVDRLSNRLRWHLENRVVALRYLGTEGMVPKGVASFFGCLYVLLLRPTPRVSNLKGVISSVYSLLLRIVPNA